MRALTLENREVEGFGDFLGTVSLSGGHVVCFNSAQGVFDDMGVNIPVLLKDASPVTHLGAAS